MARTQPIEDTVLVKLSDEERAERAFELAAKSKQVLDIEAERTALNRQMNAKLKELKLRIRECAEAYDTGMERRVAHVEAFPNESPADVLPFN